MACKVNLTFEDIRAEVFNKKTNIKPLPNQTAEDSRAYLNMIRDIFTTIKVPVQNLPREVQTSIIADAQEMVERYAVKGELTPALSKRITDEVTRKFIKSKGRVKAKEITSSPDTQIKANTGTKLHTAMQDIMELLIEISDSKSLIKNSSIKSYGYQKKSLKAIKEALGVSDKYFNELLRHQKQVLKDIIAFQEKIDPNGQVQIFTEQFVYNEKADIGGTADFLVVFSDNSYGHLDYKSMVPYSSAVMKNPVTGQMDISDPNWIPTYKYEDFNLQLPVTNNILETKFGLGTNRFTRVIPIQVHFTKKAGSHPYGESLTDKIKQITIANYGDSKTDSPTDKYLSAIPIQEKTGIDALDKSIKRLTTIKNNLLVELEHTTDPKKKEDLRLDIGRKQRLLNKLIMDKDISLLRYDISIILKRYIKNNQIVDVNSPTINNVDNPHYLSDSELRDLIQELKAYEDIVRSSMYHMKEMGIPTKEIEDYKVKIQGIAFDLGNLVASLGSSYQSRAITSEERNAIKDARSLSFWEKMFMTLSEQQHPIFRVFSKKLHNAQNQRRINSQKKFDEIKKKVLKLEEWGRKHGKSQSQIYNMLYNEETGNLHGKYDKKFYDDLKQAQESNNKVWLNKYLVPKEDAIERYENNLKRFQTKEPTAEELKSWKNRHNLKNAMRNPELWRIYFNINPNIEPDSEYYSKGHRELLKPENKPLLEFWEFYEATMIDAANMLGLRGDQRVSPNFLPWIRANTLEQMFQDGWNWENIKESVTSLMQVREDDTMFGDPTIKGKIDPVTGKPQLSVPRYYINPLKDNSNRINVDLKSRDIAKSLFVFYDMALNYNYIYNEVEPKVEALKDVMVSEGIKPAQIKGRDLKDQGGFLARFTGKDLDVATLFNTFVDYHVYGLRIQDANKDTAKFWTSLSSYQVVKELALSPLVWTGNAIQVKGNLFFTGLNGYYYTHKDQIETEKLKFGVKGQEGKDLYHSLVYFFEPSMTQKQVFEKSLIGRTSLKAVNSDTLFWGFRKAEETISNDVLVNILKNYGYNSEGELVRKKRFKAGEKTLFELAKVKDGKLTVEGVIDEKGNVDINKYTQIRDLSVGIARQITGQMNPEDIYAAQASLMWKLIMTFKSWMPGMWNARGGKLRYNAMTNSLIEGKYQVLASDMQKGNKKMLAFIGLEVIPRLSKFVALAPFIAISGSTNLYKINEERAIQQFNKFKEDYKNDADIQKMSFEDFIEYKQGQLRSLAAELTVILSFVAVLTALAFDWDDDGKADYVETWAGRTFFRIINRGRRELAFFLNPNDWYQMLRTPVPITGLAMDSIAWFKNFKDESGDLIFGEDDRTGMLKVVFGSNRGKDEKPVFFETLRFIPGHKLVKTFDIFDAYKASKI